MSQLASDGFLAQLKATYPTTGSTTNSDQIREGIENPWYIVAAVAFSASNRPEEVPRVFKFVMDEIAASSATIDDRQRVVLRMREALFKSGLISGYARAISALIALYEATPEELRDTKLVRGVDNDKVSDMIVRGDETFVAMFGDRTDSVKTLLNNVHPDMGWFARTIGAGHVFPANKVLSQRETSFILIAALVAMDTPIQLRWHLANALRAGATREEIGEVREIAMKVASGCGVKWRDGVPGLLDVA